MKDSFSAASSRSRNAMPPPTTRRAAAAGSRRAATATPTFEDNRRAPPADSLLPIASEAGTKRKERDFDDAASTTHCDSIDETKIDVFVRCRGRNEREVRENSGVVVNTDEVHGKTAELSMGPNALSKKAYSFDGVFSPMADQQMVFDEVVTPVLAEVRMQGYDRVGVWSGKRLKRG